MAQHFYTFDGWPAEKVRAAGPVVVRAHGFMFPEGEPVEVTPDVAAELDRDPRFSKVTGQEKREAVKEQKEIARAAEKDTKEALKAAKEGEK